MKNTLITLLIVFCLLFLGACSLVKAEDESRKMEATIGSSPISTGTFDSRHYASINGYGIAPSMITNNDLDRPSENKEWIKKLSIMYPQLYNLDDVSKESYLNDLIFKYALQIKDILNDRDYVEYEIDYSIMQADTNIISILFTGFVHSPQKSNNIAQAITINLDEERFMNLSELYRIDDKLLQKFDKGEFKETENKIDSDTTRNYLGDYIKNYSQYEHVHDFYIKKDTLGLIIPGPGSMNYLLIVGEFKNS